jgi:uncharacterized membrane protein YesL
MSVFRKLLNNYYYGKSGKGEYRRGDLPQNRWQQFREMLRVRLAGLFRLNLITALAFVPMIYVLIITLSALLTHLAVVAEASANPQSPVFSGNSAQEVYSILFTGSLLLIPAIAITGPAQAGMALVVRNWARDEHAFVWSDFLDAVKGNWKQALGASLMTGVVPLVVLVSYQFYGAMAENSTFFVVPQMLVIGLGVIWSLALVYMYPMMVTYKMSFRTLLRNSLLLAMGRLPHTAGARLVMLIPVAAAVVVSLATPNWMYAVMALAGYYLLFGNALARFVYAALSNAMFDRLINVRIPGAQVNRGLAEVEDIDEGEEDEPDAPTGPQNKPGSLV